MPERPGDSEPPSAPERPERPEDSEDSEPALGWCAREVEQEFPELRLLLAQVRVGRPGSLTDGSTPAVEDRLRELSNRLRGAWAVGVRGEPVPAAYRVFFRQIGLDPEVLRTPIEAAALERMLRGGFISAGLLEDVLLISLVDTSVPVWALDADCVDGPVGIRQSKEGEPLGRSAGASSLPAGRLVIADASAALAVLFGEPAPGHGAGAGTRHLTLFAVGVAGVPALYVEEALWTCRTALEQQ